MKSAQKNKTAKSASADQVLVELKPSKIWQMALYWLCIILGLVVLHFHDQRIFKRELIDYDDVYFIEPLKDVSFSNYFESKWYQSPENFPFAIKDYSFLFDYYLSDIVGFKTFWLTSFFIYLCILFLGYRVYRLYLKDSNWVAEPLLAFVAFHPVMVEAVQWASNRKHLLVALFVMLGTHHVVKISAQMRSPKFKDWIFIFGCYLAGWFTWPSISLWIFWPLYKFRNELKKDRLRFVWYASAVGIMLSRTYWAMTNHQAYAEGTEAISSFDSFLRTIVYGVEALARATASFALPFRLVPYYKLNTPAIWAGLIILLATTYLIYKNWQKLFADKSDEQKAKELLLIVLLLFAPQGMVFLTFPEFVWADRYLISSMLFLVLFLYLVLKPRIHANRLRMAPLVLALCGGLLGARTVPTWQSDHDLFTNCALTERSPKCTHLAIEKRFDDNGCEGLGDLFRLGRELMTKNELPFDAIVQMEVPLYEALCVVSDRNLNLSDKQMRLEDIKNVYKGAKFVEIASSLALLQDKQLAAGVLNSMSKFFDTQDKLSAMPKIINMLRGHGEAICTISQLYQIGYPQCSEKIQMFNLRTQNIPTKEKQVQWGMSRTIGAVNGE